MSERVFILYDSRAGGGDTENATVLVVCEDEEEAKDYKGDFGGMACYSYKEDDGKNLVDERHEWNWFPGD